MFKDLKVGFIVADVSGKKETRCINFDGCGPVITFVLVGNWNNTPLEAMVLQAELFLGGGRECYQVFRQFYDAAGAERTEEGTLMQPPSDTSPSMKEMVVCLDIGDSTWWMMVSSIKCSSQAMTSTGMMPQTWKFCCRVKLLIY